jgi:hypothetical protein
MLGVIPPNLALWAFVPGSQLEKRPAIMAKAAAAK